MSRIASGAHKSQSIVLFSVISGVVSRRVSGSHLESERNVAWDAGQGAMYER